MKTVFDTVIKLVAMDVRVLERGRGPGNQENSTKPRGRGEDTMGREVRKGLKLERRDVMAGGARPQGRGPFADFSVTDISSSYRKRGNAQFMADWVGGSTGLVDRCLSEKDGCGPLRGRADPAGLLI